MNAKERMSEVARKVNGKNHEDYERKHTNYVIKTLIEKKIRKQANKGSFSTVLRISRRFSKALVKTELELNGFVVSYISGTNKLKVIW